MGIIGDGISNLPASITPDVTPGHIGDALTIRELFIALGQTRPRCRLYRSTDQSIPNATTTAISFDGEEVDSGGLHAPSPNPTRITVPTGWSGEWMFGGCIDFASDPDGYREVCVRKNGTANLVMARFGANPGGGTVVPISTGVVPMAEGAYVELTAYQNSGGALNATGWEPAPYFWGYWIATL